MALTEKVIPPITAPAMAAAFAHENNCFVDSEMAGVIFRNNRSPLATPVSKLDANFWLAATMLCIGRVNLSTAVYMDGILKTFMALCPRWFLFLFCLSSFHQLPSHLRTNIPNPCNLSHQNKGHPLVKVPNDVREQHFLPCCRNFPCLEK